MTVLEKLTRTSLSASAGSASSSSWVANTPAVTTTASRPPSASRAASIAGANVSGFSRSQTTLRVQGRPRPVRSDQPRCARGRRCFGRGGKSCPHAPPSDARAHAPSPWLHPETQLSSQSPSKRTDCALRNLRFGSQRSRIALNSSSRAPSIASKCSRRVNESLAR